MSTQLEQMRGILVMLKREIDSHASNPDKYELPKAAWVEAVDRFEKLDQPTPPTPAGAGTETATCISCGYIASIIQRDFTTDEMSGVVTTVPNVEMMKCEKCGDVVITMKGHQLIDSWLALARHLKIKDLEAELLLLRRQAEADRATKQAELDHRIAINAALNKTDARGNDEIEQIEWLAAQLATADKDRERIRAALEMASGRMAYMAGAFGSRFSDEDKNINRVVFKEIRAALQPSPSLDHGATGEKTP